MIVGSIEEIKNQDIYMGDYIKQYAIIQYVDNGATYTDLCQDCSCTITISNNKYGEILNNAQTQEINTGLFGYKTEHGLFYSEQTYYALFNCTSIEYGQGLAYSQVNILTNNQVNTGLSPNSENIITTTQSIQSEQSFLDKVLERLDKSLNSITNMPSQVLKIFEMMFDTLIFFGDTLDTFTHILYLAVYNPVDGFKVMLSLFWNLFKPFIYYLSAPIILYEFYIISFVAIKQPWDKMFSSIIEAQIKIIITIKNVFDQMLNYIMIIINLIINIIKALPGT